MPLWFSTRPEQDEEIRAKFGALLKDAEQPVNFLSEMEQNEALTPEQVHAAEPWALLCNIILFDQFPRNIFRGKPQSFAWDAHACQLTYRLLESGRHLELRPMEWAIACLPLEHSENVEDHQQMKQRVTELEQLAQELQAETLQKPVKAFQQFAQEHREVVEKFGRYPHRNAIIGRENTPEEAAFLSSGEAKDWGAQAKDDKSQ